MTLRNIFMYEYNLLLGHNCGFLYSEEWTTGGFLRMATNKPPCVIKAITGGKTSFTTTSFAVVLTLVEFRSGSQSCLLLFRTHYNYDVRVNFFNSSVCASNKLAIFNLAYNACSLASTTPARSASNLGDIIPKHAVWWLLFIKVVKLPFLPT